MQHLILAPMEQFWPGWWHEISFVASVIGVALVDKQQFNPSNSKNIPRVFIASMKQSLPNVVELRCKECLPRFRNLLCSQSREEREFIGKVRQPASGEIRQFVQLHSDRLSVNCCDLSGETALEIAVGQHDEALVEELLTLDGLSSGHLFAAILRAVQEDLTDILETLMQVYQRQYMGTAAATGAEQGVTWTHPDFGMTPLMSASSDGNVQMTRHLLDKGLLIEKPHHPKCRCSQPKCVSRQTEGETLFQSLARIHAYRALSSPCHMMLTSDDPILTAFQLSKELDSLARHFPEHKKDYVELSNRCSQFAADLLDQCRDTREVETVLVQRQGFRDPRPRLFSRLQLAIDYKQKKFVVHASCQQVIREAWVEGLPMWVTWSDRRRFAYVLVQALLTPLAALAYVLLPTSFVLKPVRVPLNRFIYSVTAYMWFLALIMASILYGANHETQTPPQRAIEFALGVWILGHTWELVLDMFLLGLSTFFRSWWLVYDLIMFGGFFFSVGLWLLLLIFNIWDFNTHPSTRMSWPWYHPFLIAEGIYALSSILAFGRVLLWYQIHAKMGPLGTSLRYMLGDVSRFLLIVFVFLFAFGIGINSIYRNYKHSTEYYQNGTIHKVQPEEFVTLQRTLKTLFWAGLGMASPDYAALVVNGTGGNQHRYTELLGYGMWAVYHLVTVIVLLNMLIAMMADSFQRVQQNSDAEWKFNRSCVLLAFFDKQSTLPSPFNLLPSIYGVLAFCRGIKALACRKNVEPVESQCCYWETDMEREKQRIAEENYQHLLGELIRRYLHNQETRQRREIVQTLSTSAIQRLKSEIMAEIRPRMSISVPTANTK